MVESVLPKPLNMIFGCLIIASIIVAFVPIVLGGFTDISNTGIAFSVLFTVAFLIVFSAAIFLFLKREMTN